MTGFLRILHLEDDPLDAELVKSALDDEGIACKICLVSARNDFIAAVDNGGFDIILSDFSLPNFDGLSALAIVKERSPDIPFIFVTGIMGEELAIETLKNGATDYVLKTSIARLAPSLQRALREATERSERRKAVEDLRNSHEQLRYLAAHLQSAREEERGYIAREIHDELGQTLSRLKLDLSWLKKRLTNEQQQLIEKTEKMSGLIDTTITAVQRISSELRPGVLDYLGLTDAIEWQVKEFVEQTGIECSAAIANDISVEDKSISTAVFRIVQEALTNVIRHSKATCVNVDLANKDNALVLEVRDNGTGIDAEKISSRSSFGLMGMRERARFLGGEINILGIPGKGTTVRVSIPLGFMVDV